MRTTWAFAMAMGIGATLLLAEWTYAHCDSVGGPVIPEAKAALEKGDVTPILKWVKQDDEAEIKAAFATALAVRAKGPEAKKLADRYFLETLVRVHRAGEGAAYTGIKEGSVDPVAAMADKALADGSADEMIKKIRRHMEAEIREKFAAVVAAKKTKDESVANGRKFVDAYVTYVHYVEGVHSAIMSAGSQCGGAPGTPAESAAHTH